MKRFFCLLTAVILLLTAGCGTPNYVFLEYDLTDAPGTLDPQFASTDTECLIAANLFEGLVRLASDGTISPACAQDWEISDGGRTYTFALRDKIFWSDGSLVTADDFVFAFERLFAPGAASLHAESYSGILGAREILAGEAQLSALGVSSPDERTLVIRLEEANASFLSLLAQTPAMPCSRAFFEEQKGRYGLSDGRLLTNGPFELYSWGSSRVRLCRAQHYGEPVSIDGVNLNLSQTDAAGRYLAGETSACLFDGGSLPDGVKGELFYDRSWALLLNPASEAFSDERLRAAVLGALTQQTLVHTAPSPARPSEGLIPPAVTIGAVFYRETAGAPALPEYPDDPRQTMLDAFAALEIERFPKAELLVCKDETGTAVGGAMQSDWSTKLSAYFNMEPLALTELTARVQNGAFEMALAPLSAQGADETKGLALFASLLKDGAAELEALLQDVRRQSSPEAAAQDLLLAEEAVLSEYLAVPVYDTPSLFACAQGIGGIWYEPAVRIVYFKDAVVS